MNNAYKFRIVSIISGSIVATIILFLLSFFGFFDALPKNDPSYSTVNPGQSMTTYGAVSIFTFGVVGFIGLYVGNWFSNIIVGNYDDPDNLFDCCPTIILGLVGVAILSVIFNIRVLGI